MEISKTAEKDLTALRKVERGTARTSLKKYSLLFSQPILLKIVTQCGLKGRNLSLLAPRFFETSWYSLPSRLLLSCNAGIIGLEVRLNLRLSPDCPLKHLNV